MQNQLVDKVLSTFIAIVSLSCKAGTWPAVLRLVEEVNAQYY